MEGEGGSEGEWHADDGHGHGGVGLYMEDTRWMLMYGAWSKRFGYDEGRRRDMSVDQCACVSHINITQLPDKRAMHGTGPTPSYFDYNAMMRTLSGQRVNPKDEQFDQYTPASNEATRPK